MAADPGRTPQPSDRTTPGAAPANVVNTGAAPTGTVATDDAATAGRARSLSFADGVGDLAAPVPVAGTKEGLAVEDVARSAGPWARAGAEAIGTFLLIFGGLGGVLSGLLVQTGGIPGPVVLGLAMVVGVLAFGHISGGHFNPALTLGAAIAGRTRWVHTPFYLLGQLVGGFAAAGLLYLVLHGHPQLGGTLPNVFSALSNGYDSHSPTQFPLTSVLLVEAIGTALFVAVVLGATARRANNLLAALAAGFGLTVVLAVTGPISNGAINPIRSTVAAVFAEGWAVQQLWVFWAAPLLGGLLAGLVFRSFLPVAPRATTGTDDDVADDEDEAPGPVERTGDRPARSTVTVRRDDANGPVSGHGDAGAPAAEPEGRHAAPTAAPEHEVRDFFDRRDGER
ncbi:aquaporin [Tersicoccus sp. MR15.9]|uniref:MIP/aquaporin family protein n=1 Tax=Tersicoccus mangrovi TaxID=3121635 RepID=UPI002FE59BA2